MITDIYNEGSIKSRVDIIICVPSVLHSIKADSRYMKRNEY